jgi:hypothetical protein
MRKKEFLIEVNWLEDDQEYIATCKDFPSLCWLDTDADKARAELKKSIREFMSEKRRNNMKFNTKRKLVDCVLMVGFTIAVFAIYFGLLCVVARLLNGMVR